MNEQLYTGALVVVWLDFAALLATVVVTIVKNQKITPAFRWLAHFLWICIPVEVVAKLYLHHVLEGSNHYLLHLYTPAEFWLLSWCYLHLLPLNNTRQRTLRWSVFTLGSLITGYSLVALMWPQTLPNQSVVWFNKLLVNGAMMVYAIWLFVLMIQTPNRFTTHPAATVTLNSAVILYFAGTFMVFVGNELLVNEAFEITFGFWVANVLLILLFHMLILVSLWQTKPAT